MEQEVLVFRSVGRGQAGYYLDGPGRGRWLGAGCAALGLEGAVAERAFKAALGGCRGDGSALLARIQKNRRAGFDLIFAAPKSVSLLAALAPAADAAKLAAAHDAAVADAVDYLEQWAVRTRRDHNSRRIATEGVIGAAWVHRTSWAGDPHMHTHVVVANLVLGRDGRWSCLDRPSLWQHTRAAGALYQASLRHHVGAAGLTLAWQVRGDGLADVRGVPRSAIEACSRRRRELLAEAEAAGLTSAGGRAAAAGRTRRNRPTESVADPGWEARAAEAGLDRAKVADLLSVAATPAPDGGTWAPLDIEERLTETTSAFTRADVVAALAATAPAGAGLDAIEREADRFLGSAVPIDGRRWTTARVQRLDRAMVEALDDRWRSAGLVPPGIAEAAIGDRPGLDLDQQAAVRRLTTGGTGIDVLGPTSLVRQAGVVAAAKAAWEAAGHRVAVVAGSERAEARWRALAGPAPQARAPSRASVVIVDGADGWSTVSLHQLVDDMVARGGKVVLVIGGTGDPRREPASAGLAALAERVGSIHLGPDVAAPEVGTDLVAQGPPAGTIRGGRDRTVVLAPTPTDAARCLVSDWHSARAGPDPATMVALGRGEADYLNRLARATLAAAGELTGPVLTAGSREFQAGDDVRVLRRDRRIPVSVGTTGHVTSVDPRRSEATVCWGDRTAVVPAAVLAGRAVSHGYAITPGYLRHGCRGPILALGPCAGPGAPGATIYIVAPRTVRGPQVDPVGDLAAALSPAARPIPRPVGRTLAELESRRDLLAAGLLASAPADVTAARRRADEDRAWLAADQGPGRRASELAELDRRRQSLDEAQRRRSAWIESHRDDLERWRALDDAAAWRVEALGRGAELAPTRAVADRLGPAPDDERGRQAWRRGAEAIEAYRDRWGVPDEVPASLSLHALHAQHAQHAQHASDPARRIDQLRVMNACRTADRSRTSSLGVDDDLAISAR
jgi:conjugative relaxase-like TrwC/TraI family protein